MTITTLTLAAACTSKPQRPSPSSSPATTRSTTSPAAAGGGWDGQCSSLLGRPDWFKVVDKDGTCDSGSSLLIVTSQQCGDGTWVSAFADEYYGRSSGPLRRGRAPAGLFDC